MRKLPKSKFAALLQLVRGGNSAEQRVFALLELICFPVSIVTLFVLLPLKIISAKYGVFQGVTVCFGNAYYSVMQAASIGYLTNWIAIEMLFKPFDRTYKHWAAFITLGYWKQGLIPKNKPKIAATIGEQALTLLRNDNALADRILEEASKYLSDKEKLQGVVDGLHEQVQIHLKEIVSILSPVVENAIINEISIATSAERLISFWDGHVQPVLESSQVRAEIADMIIQALHSHSAEISEKARPCLKKCVNAYLCRRLGGLGSVLGDLSDGVIDSFVEDRSVERGLKEWFSAPEAAATIRQELANGIRHLRIKMESPENKKRIDEFSIAVRNLLAVHVRERLTVFLENISETLDAGKIAMWVGVAIEKNRALILQKLKDEIPAAIDRFNVPAFIRDQINKKTTEEFYDDINEIAAQHLGAIQVLGFILGAIIESLNVFFAN